MMTTVIGLEMTANRCSVDGTAHFTYMACGSGYEIIMHYRGERRFALCTHKNDAEVIVDALNKRDKP